MSTMKAVRIHAYGGPEALSYDEIPRPVPAADELLIRVHAASVNPVDWKLRDGSARRHLELPMPAILGGDISGVVEQMGAAVQGFAVGEAVYAQLGLIGAYAQYVTVKSSSVAPKPKSLSHVEAASVPLAGLTAWQGLFEQGKLTHGHTVLIHAAAGGVGGFAVQFAKAAGAWVVGTCSANNADYVRSLGAAEVIDYHAARFEEHVRDLDMVVDLIGGETAARSIGVLKPGGVLVQISPGTAAVAEKAAAAHVRAIAIRVHPDGRQLREIAALIDAGKVKTSVAAEFPPEQAGSAQELNKAGHTRGKIVLNFEH